MAEAAGESGEGEGTFLDPPSEFPFPFTPYPSQKGFMSTLFDVLEHGGLGIFESPTGTVSAPAPSRPQALGRAHTAAANRPARWHGKWSCRVAAAGPAPVSRALGVLGTAAVFSVCLYTTPRPRPCRANR